MDDVDDHDRRRHDPHRAGEVPFEDEGEDHRGDAVLLPPGEVAPVGRGQATGDRHRHHQLRRHRRQPEHHAGHDVDAVDEQQPEQERGDQVRRLRGPADDGAEPGPEEQPGDRQAEHEELPGGEEDQRDQHRHGQPVERRTEPGAGSVLAEADGA
ncbi:hypothetical protein JNW91_08250 [Micromonospora sp. STR1_7]|uniref:Uncharacterized protein n=1 Tax=Micromonospora parastrephiae TaxID=2806101 RepID=A0ABS1XRG8_9ACTN|nr:hypothetical protein [Micromonospora parastrephiae]MBM0231847.1 hypothetical protein [Micromonospora parastrephiae]